MFLRRLLVALGVAVLLALVGSGVYAWANGVRFYAVDSGSMAPAFNTGALLVDLPVTPTTALHVGDVVTFHPTPGYTATHRIAALGAGGITTKGDANPSRDAGSLQPGMVVGRVALAIPYAGYAVVFFQQPLDVAALLLLLLGLLVVWHLTAASPTPRPSDARMGQEPS